VQCFVYYSVQFGTNISIAQLNRMSHCAPEATLNPIRLVKFTPETVVSNVFVAQVCWEAVPDMCLGNSKAPVAKCVVCAWNSARSVVFVLHPLKEDYVFTSVCLSACLSVCLLDYSKNDFFRRQNESVRFWWRCISRHNPDPGLLDTDHDLDSGVF